jgi:hypothetical protein
VYHIVDVWRGRLNKQRVDSVRADCTGNVKQATRLVEGFRWRALVMEAVYEGLYVCRVDLPWRRMVLAAFRA